LPPQLAAFELPPPPTHERLVACWAALRRFLAVGPARVMYPLSGYIWRTTLGPIDCSLHLEGESGVFKSEIAALVRIVVPISERAGSIEVADRQGLAFARDILPYLSRLWS